MKTELVLSTNQIQTVVRHETLGGRDYLVAPVVAIRAGVLNNELAPVEEIARFVEAWNGIPVPLGHPARNGLPISANSPELEASSVVGRFWRAEMVDDRLRGEIWIDVEKAKAMGGDAVVAMERIETGVGIEVSTAYHRELEPTPGVINGQRYQGIQRNMRPDHLALLLHQIGACSWKDGCGVPRTNAETSNLTNHQTGVMVALFPSPEAAASMAINADGLPAGAIITPANEIHLTLAYLGDLDKGEVNIEQGELLRRVMDWAANTPIVRGMVSGYGRFTTPNSEGLHPVFALYDCEYLAGWRYWLMDWLPMKANHGFTPHITLAYIPTAAPIPNLAIEPRELVFDRIGIGWGGQITTFPLQGEAAEVGAANAKSSTNPIAGARQMFRKLAQVLGFPAHTEETSGSTPVNNQNIQTEEGSMDKKDLIESLAANKRHPFTKEDLDAMPEAALTRLSQAVNSGGCGGAAAPAAGTDQSAPAQNAKAGDVQVPAELQALAAFVKDLGGLDGVKSALSTIQANADSQKSSLVDELKSNERCAFTEDELKAMPVAQLSKLAASLRGVSYAGRGGPRGNSRQDDDGVPAPQPVILAKVEAK